ncbi:MAG: hypothetical protein HW421_1038 [Ignavibacteria bacterium]|nr:hypothetical protein [Ignavibacteria bacterium]
MRIFPFLFIILISATSLQAINPKDTIRTEYSFWGNSYYIGDKEYSKSDIVDTLYANKVSQDLMSSSKYKKIGGYLTGIAGLYITSWACSLIYNEFYSNENVGSGSYSRNYFSNQTKDKTIYVSALAVVVDISCIYLFSSSNSSFRKSIKAYNKNILKPMSNSASELNLHFGLNRIVLEYTF